MSILTTERALELAREFETPSPETAAYLREYARLELLCRRLTGVAIDGGDVEFCEMDCGTLIFDGDERYVVTFENDDTAPCCKACYDEVQDERTMRDGAASPNA